MTGSTDETGGSRRRGCPQISAEVGSNLRHDAREACVRPPTIAPRQVETPRPPCLRAACAPRTGSLAMGQTHQAQTADCRYGRGTSPSLRLPETGSHVMVHREWLQTESAAGFRRLRPPGKLGAARSTPIASVRPTWPCGAGWDWSSDATGREAGRKTVVGRRGASHSAPCEPRLRRCGRSNRIRRLLLIAGESRPDRARCTSLRFPFENVMSEQALLLFLWIPQRFCETV